MTPRLIFLDTSVIRQANFALSSVPFRVLHALAGHGEIEVLTSDITLSECEALLMEQLEKVVASTKKANSEAQLFGNVSDALQAGPIPVPDPAVLGPQLVDHLRSYFAAPGFTTLQATARPAAAVFHRYFSRKPPLGDGKKKAEFPDAFVLDALAEVAATRGAAIDVVSGDNDWAVAANDIPGLRHHQSLAALLEELQQLPSADVAKADALFRAERRNLEYAIGDIIVNQWVHFEDSVGEVQSIYVEAIEVEEPHLMTLNDQGVATYECNATATLTLEAHVPRESSYIYDSEEKQGYYADWNYITIEREVALVVEFSMDLSNARKVEFEHTPFRINYGRPIAVYLDTSAEDHYK